MNVLERKLKEDGAYMSKAEKESLAKEEALTGEVIEPKKTFGHHNGGGGRPKGSRNKLARAFITDLQSMWVEEGIPCLRVMVREDPTKFVQVVASLMPKELDINVSKWDGYSDDQLLEQFAGALEEAKALGIDIGLGSAAGTHNTIETQPALTALPGDGTTKT